MRFLAYTVLFCLLGAGAAQASSFVWKDPVNDFTFSYPDTWNVQTDDVANTRIRVASPEDEDIATCRVKTEKDGRLKIYPKALMSKAVNETLNIDFWEGEVAQYQNAEVLAIRAPASMGGQGDATAIKTSFVLDSGNGKVNMYGLMIGSIYGDTRYIISCTSRAEVFGNYAATFASIMGSVELERKYTPFATSYYRDFLADPKLVLPRSKPGTVTP